MLDPGAYQRALLKRQGGMPQPQEIVPGQQFNQEVVPGFLFSQDQPPMEMPPMQQQEQIPPDLMQFLIALLGQQNGPGPG